MEGLTKSIDQLHTQHEQVVSQAVNMQQTLQGLTDG